MSFIIKVPLIDSISSTMGDLLKRALQANKRQKLSTQTHFIIIFFIQFTLPKLNTKISSDQPAWFFFSLKEILSISEIKGSSSPLNFIVNNSQNLCEYHIE